MQTLNLGILAHVDAGKTSLTERLLYAAGVIDEIGSVDDGSTQTDSLALERLRGITIKSAVASFTVGDVSVNLIDTPGHPDFIAEVERVLGVLDGAVLVISAVEGVQAQTRVLMRTLLRLRIPTLIFVNKIDRGGAGYERVLADIATKLTPAIAPMGSVCQLGSPSASWLPYGAADVPFPAGMVELLAENDDAVLAAYIDDPAAVTPQQLRASLAAQSVRAQLHPVFFGSAITGTGIDCLTSGIAELLPAAGGDANAPVSGSVFKVERGRSGEKIAYVRLFSGRVRARERLRFGEDAAAKVTAVSVFGAGQAEQRTVATAGSIAKLWGLADVRVGDQLGSAQASGHRHHFAPPTLETVVVPSRRADRGALHAALAQLSEQDPLINLRVDDIRQEILVCLYGEVQKEVIQATLADDFGLEVWFRKTTTICIERPVGTGAAAEFMGSKANPFRATVGLRIAPAAPGSGVQFGHDVELGSMPFSFMKAVEETVRETLIQGIYGWPVADCTVSMTHSGYTPPPPFGWSKWSSSAGDFRGLTPLVTMSALQQAGTTVCEPINEFRLEIPADCLPAVLTALARLRAVEQKPEMRGPGCIVTGEIPVGHVHGLQQQLPAMTRGEGVLEAAFACYRPVSGPAPTRPRTDHNPLNRKDYLLHVQHGIRP